MANPPKRPRAETETVIQIPPLRRGIMTLRVIGETPMFMNRMAAKAKRTLLVGGTRKTKAERVELKHDPFAEFVDSMEQVPDGPTALGLRVVAFKAAMCTAALETAGITKTSAQKLLFFPNEFVPLYGLPQLRMNVVRSADMNRTPDVRTRAFLPRWGFEIEVHHVLPQLSQTAVATLAANAGILIGLGDFRQEKGKGNFGLFSISDADSADPRWNDLVKNHGRAAQLAAIADPISADPDTDELLQFFISEKDRRK